jgi:hypothetical protein
MRNHTRVLTACAIILSATAIAGARAQTPALGAGAPATISPEALQRQIDAGSLPITIIDELY